MLLRPDTQHHERLDSGLKSLLEINMISHEALSPKAVGLRKGGFSPSLQLSPARGERVMTEQSL
jgi:hypothetical protein